VISHEDGSVEVHAPWEEFLSVKDALVAADLRPESSDIAMIASTTVEQDVESAQKILDLIDALEDLDDVQNVYTNAAFPDAAFE